MTRKAKQYLSGVKKVGVVRRAEGSPPRGEGKVGPGKMTSVGSRFISELFNPKKAAEDVENVGRSYLDMLSAYNTFLYKQSPEEQAAFVASLPSKTREAIGSAATALRDLPQTAKRAVEEATPESTAAAVRRFGVESAMDPTRLIKGTAPATSQVVRPRGEGVVLDYPDAPEVTLTTSSAERRYKTTRAPRGYLVEAIERGKRRIDPTLAPEHRQAIENFLDTKVRNYYKNQYATKDDPIFKAIKEGRISTEKLRAPGGIREYMPADVAEGKTRVNPETGESTFYPSKRALAALEDVNRIYDEMTGMGGNIFTSETIGRPDYESLPLDIEKQRLEDFRDITTQRLIDEGIRPTEINPRLALVGYKDPKYINPEFPGRNVMRMGDYSSESGNVAALALSDKTIFPKELATTIQKQQPVYDPAPIGPLREILSEETLVDYLNTLPTREIKNLRYEDAIRGSVKAAASIRTREALAERIRKNQPVDPKVFLEGVSAPLISYAEDSPFAGLTWRRITNPEATAIEGAYIGHSVGGYAKGGGYGPELHKEFLEGKSQAYTLRDKRGRPITTVEVKDNSSDYPDYGGPVVTQVKGAGRATGNVQPSGYDSALVDLFKKLGVVRVLESDTYLPPLARDFKNELRQTSRTQGPTRLPPQPLPVRQPLPEQRPLEQQGIGQLPQPPQPPINIMGPDGRPLPRRQEPAPDAENFARGMNNQQLVEFVRRLFRDQD
jgi:hypothetical protein